MRKLGVFVNRSPIVYMHNQFPTLPNIYWTYYSDGFNQLYTVGLVCDIALKNPEVKQWSTLAKKFDLMLVEKLQLLNCFMALVHKFFNVPVIYIISSSSVV